eukprot:RCo027069
MSTASDLKRFREQLHRRNELLVETLALKAEVKVRSQKLEAARKSVSRDKEKLQRILNETKQLEEEAALIPTVTTCAGRGAGSIGHPLGPSRSSLKALEKARSNLSNYLAKWIPLPPPLTLTSVDRQDWKTTTVGFRTSTIEELNHGLGQIVFFARKFSEFFGEVSVPLNYVGNTSTIGSGSRVYKLYLPPIPTAENEAQLRAAIHRLNVDIVQLCASQGLEVARSPKETPDQLLLHGLHLLQRQDIPRVNGVEAVKVFSQYTADGQALVAAPRSNPPERPIPSRAIPRRGSEAPPRRGSELPRRGSAAPPLQH